MTCELAIARPAAPKLKPYPRDGEKYCAFLQEVLRSARPHPQHVRLCWSQRNTHLPHLISLIGKCPHVFTPDFGNFVNLRALLASRNVSPAVCVPIVDTSLKLPMCVLPICFPTDLTNCVPFMIRHFPSSTNGPFSPVQTASTNFFRFLPLI